MTTTTTTLTLSSAQKETILAALRSHIGVCEDLGGLYSAGRFSSSNPNFREQLPSHGPEAVSPTGRLSRSMPEFQDLPKNTTATASALTGKRPSIVIIDDPGDATASKLARALADVDLSDVELRIMAANIEAESASWAEAGRKMHEAFGDLGDAFKNLRQQMEYKPLTAGELRADLSFWDIIPIGDKHERQHADHPTEKNPNHPRFQRQPHKPRRNRQRKQK